jgi:hypothetical protein
MSSAHLEDVAFRLHFSRKRGGSSDEISTALEWHDVDAILQRAAFFRLRRVRFQSNIPFSVGSTSGGPQSSSAWTSIIQHLSQCHARGILRVDQ